MPPDLVCYKPIHDSKPQNSTCLEPGVDLLALPAFPLIISCSWEGRGDHHLCAVGTGVSILLPQELEMENLKFLKYHF